MNNDFYIILKNGEPIEPIDGDMMHKLGMAETILDFLQAVCPDDEFSIAKVIFKDTPNSRVL